MNWIIVLYPDAMSNAQRQPIVFTTVRLSAASMRMQ